ncbi:MAG TPA: cyclase family protein [Actinomycetota bacterium]
MRSILGVATLLAAGVAGAFELDETRLVDLTHPFDATTIYWPTQAPFALERLARGRTPAGHWYAANRFCAAEHGGTHLDAPVHFAEGGAGADAVPLARLVGPAVVVDVVADAARDPDLEVAVAHLERHERAHGRIPSGAIVLVRTGWGARWPDRRRYLGDDTPGDAWDLHFPGVSRAAAAWLVAERRIDAVGIDTASIDHGPSRRFEAHQALAAAGVPVFENVAGLERLPATGASLVALPMKIAGGSGGPLRVIAVLPPAR